MRLSPLVKQCVASVKFPSSHMATYIHVHTPGHQAASRGHIVLRMPGQSRRLQCPSLGRLSPLGEGREKREEEEEVSNKG